MTTKRNVLTACLLVIVIHGTGPTAHARISADAPAAIVTFPLVRADAIRGEDTTIQLSNADAAPVDVACFLQQLVGHCTLTPQQPCSASSDCELGDVCDGIENVVTPFKLRLTASQPLRWQLSADRPALPLPENDGAIPQAPSDPFVGSLRCVAVDGNGSPVERNVLQGEATLGRYEPGLDRIDAAQYNGIGLSALPGTNDGDSRLVLGGPSAEYDACPSMLILNHFLDHALEPSARTSQLLTTLTLVPCGAELFGRVPPTPTVVQFLVVNEFEQRFSTSRPFATQQSLQLSLIDTTVPTRSIFSAGILGTLAAQTRIRGVADGIMGIAVEGHYDLADPTRVATAAFNLHSEGEQSTGDVVTVGPCAAGPRTGCRSAQSNSLSLSRAPAERGDRAVWKWRNGEATAAADLGDPTTTSDTHCASTPDRPPTSSAR